MCIQYTFNVYQYICYLAYANLLTYSLTHVTHSLSYPKSRDAIGSKNIFYVLFIYHPRRQLNSRFQNV